MLVIKNTQYIEKYLTNVTYVVYSKSRGDKMLKLEKWILENKYRKLGMEAAIDCPF